MMSSFRASGVGGDNGTVVMMHHLMHAGGRLFSLVCYPRKGETAPGLDRCAYRNFFFCFIVLVDFGYPDLNMM